MEAKANDYEQQLSGGTNSKKLKEQRDLLIDLRQKVSMYEREVKLISDQSQSEIDVLQKRLDNYERKEQDQKLNEHIATEIEATTKIQTKELLMNTKSELE